MQILIATPLSSKDSGGPAQYAERLKEEFQKNGHTVEMVTFANVRHYPSGIRHILFFLTLLRSVYRMDVVLVLDTVSVAIPAILASYIFGTKVILRIGGDFLWESYIHRTGEAILLSEFYRKKRRLSLKEQIIFFLQKYLVISHAHLLVFTTPWQERIWSEPYNLSRTQSVIIENAYLPYEISGKRDIPKYDVVWVGRDIPLKNVATLDTAVREIQKTRTLRYEKFSGISHEKVQEILRASRMLVIPSFSEVSPNVALEALSVGTPVLLTSDCGFKELLPNHFVWIDPKNASDIQKHIEMTLRGELGKVFPPPLRRYEDLAAEYALIFSRI